MRIDSFNVTNQRSIVLARCDAVPALMIVAGPNGCGKSTLLHALRQQPGDGSILYVGPHRTFRRQQVQGRQLLAGTISMEEFLARMDVPGGFEGIQVFSGTRDPWSGDDTANFLKHGLCQIESERERSIAARFDRDGSIPKGSVEDAWQPLRALTTNLLPHLAFERIDTANQTQIRCLWKVHKRDLLVDLDDLSSGEKSIIQMFYPLVEHQIRERLRQISGAPPSGGGRSSCLLIDEPELHLHPNLQAKVLDYMRHLAYEERVQVILATHSPTIVEYANDEELYLLRPSELVESAENQLTRVASNEERLQFLREVFGGTPNLTALQPILIVEGVHEHKTSGVVSDRKLYRALSPSFDRVTVIPGGGKSECLKLRAALAPALAQFAPHLRVAVLLDRDTSEASAPAQGAGTYILPVSMIENLLLDPEAIWEAIQSVVEKTDLNSADDVAEAIDRVLDAMNDEECDRRVLAAIGVVVFRPTGPSSTLQQQVSEFLAKVTGKYEPSTISGLQASAVATVSALKTEQKRREFYHGKEVLDRFFKRHLHSTGLAKVVFHFETARHARQRKSVTSFFEGLFADLVPEPAAAAPDPAGAER